MLYFLFIEIEEFMFGNDGRDDMERGLVVER